MRELISLYQWTVLAGVLSAGTLSLLGVHLATRDRAMQTLCVGQGAMFGVLLFMGLFHFLEGTFLGGALPLIGAFVFSGLTFLAAEWLASKKVASRNTHFAFLLVVLMAGSYLMSAFFPALENHMSQIYFGDLATLSEGHSIGAIYTASIALAIFLFFGRSISNGSFESAVFGLEAKSVGAKQEGFRYFSLLVLCLSVQSLGFLFTISMLFLPTALLSFLTNRGLRCHLLLCIVCSGLGAALGFLTSLSFTRLPTVPSIVMMTCAFCFFAWVLDFLWGQLGFGNRCQN